VTNYHEDTMHSEFGWKVRRIKSVNNGSVTFDIGWSVASECFADAKAGELWAVKHEERRPWAFGKVEVAVKLEDAE
jgi:hypothetical protein